MSRSRRSSVISNRQPAPDAPKKVKKQSPQKTVDQLWEAFTTKHPGKVRSILPNNIYAETKAAKSPKGVVHSQKAGKSFDEAVAECRHAVAKIAKECRRVNMKYRDPHFDIEFDLKCGKRDTLNGLVPGDGFDLAPKSVKRVTQIFDNPVFMEEGATASDVRQGADGDCWFMSALCALGGKDNLISRICVARDEKVGVYGFVFHRDGEWIQTIIDDKLFLIAADWDESLQERFTWSQINRLDAEEEYRKSEQSGSRSLYFAQCRNENETWLPLLEKAYAKAHGDYSSIWGGFTGEAIEDLTGGVTTELFTSDILDTDKFWTDEIMKVNKDFLFGCSTGVFDAWRTGWSLADRKDIVSMHAYSILEAREVKGERLLRVRNPWGQFEWKGAWSDGSEQWTPEWMQLLDHKFGDDGMFWISYKDLLRKYQCFDRTRLFGPDWHVTQQWTTLDVPWTADYNDTKFSVTMTKASPVVIVLSKLDERYFKGLEGQYFFSLHFRLEKDGEQDYIVRSHGNYLMDRAVSVDLDLEPGTYSVLMKITAWRLTNKATPEQVVRETCRDRQDKLLQIGLSYDLAHAKGQIKETEDEKKIRLEREAKKKAADHQKKRQELRSDKLKYWEVEKKRVARLKRQVKRKKAHDKKVEARKAATGKAAQDSEKTNPATAGKDATAVADQAAKEDSPATTETVKQDTPATTDESAAAPKPEETKPEGGETTTEGNITGETKPEDAKHEQTKSDEGKAGESEPLGSGAATEPPTQAEVEAAVKRDGGVSTTKDNKEGASANAEPSTDIAAEDKAAQFEAALKNVPSDIAKGIAPPPTAGPGTVAAAATAPPPSTAGDNNNSDWEHDSLASFNSSIVTDLDFPTTTSPPPEDAAAIRALLLPPANAVDPANPSPEEDEDDENAEFANDPWNAVCVVGLRVYSKAEGLSISIVRPKSEDEDEDTPLDLDDNSKGASGETTNKEETGVSTGDLAQDKTRAEIKEGGIRGACEGSGKGCGYGGFG